MKRTKEAAAAAAMTAAARKEVKKVFDEIRKAGVGNTIRVTKKSLDPRRGLVHYETYRAVADEIFGAAGEKQKTLTLAEAVEALLAVEDKSASGGRVEASRMLALTLTLSGVGEGKPADWLDAVNGALELTLLDDRFFATGVTRTARFNLAAVRHHADRIQQTAGQMLTLAANSRKGVGEKKELSCLMTDLVAEAEGLAKAWHANHFSASRVFKDLLHAVIRYGGACMQGYGVGITPSPSEAMYGCIRTLRSIARARAALASSRRKAGLPDRYAWVCWVEGGGAAAVEAMHAEMGKLAAEILRRRYAKALRAASR